MALQYGRTITSGGSLTELSDVLFQSETFGPQPDWITLGGDQIQLEEPGTPWPIRVVHSFEVQFTSGSAFDVEAVTYVDGNPITTSIGSFPAGTHTVLIESDVEYDGSSGSATQPAVVEVHTTPDTTMVVLAGGHQQIHTVEPTISGTARWSVGLLVWGLTFPCFQAATSEDIVAPGGDIGTANINFDTVLNAQPWASPGDPITIVAGENPFGFDTTANFRIRIRGVISSFDVVQIAVILSDGGGTITTGTSGDIGPGTNIPIDIVFDLNTSLSVGDTYFYDFNIADGNGGGATLQEGATVMFCYTSIPG